MTEPVEAALPHPVEPEDRKPDAHVVPAERDLEVSPEDAIEQATPVDPKEQPETVHRGLEVNEADALDQARVVDLGDDEYA